MHRRIVCWVAALAGLALGVSPAPALIVAPYSTGLFQIQTILPGLPPGAQPIAVYLDGRMMAQGSIFIQ